MARPTISFEVFPPAPGPAEARFWQAIDRLAALDPAFVSVTYGAGGSARERSDRAVRTLMARDDVAAAGHLTCVGERRADVDSLARGWAAGGLRRMVALRGDPPGMSGPFRAHPEGYRDAAELVAGLMRIADFDISVAAYPEAHPDSPSTERDLDNLKRKLDAGAARALTQYFFDAEVFLRFRDRARRAGIAAPIVPGILPVFHVAKVASFSRKCGATVPAWLRARFEGLDDDPPTRDMVAATTASELCRRLMAEGVDAFHIYTLNRADLPAAICRMLDVRPKLEKAA